MRKFLIAAAGFAALAGAAGLAIAHEGGHEGHRGMFRGDANNDGVITSQEFDARHDAMFARADANNDGSLSQEELASVHQHRREGHRRGGMRGERHGAHMEGADANNDGNITREEFLARPQEMFARLDANNDGVISAQEREQMREAQLRDA